MTNKRIIWTTLAALFCVGLAVNAWAEPRILWQMPGGVIAVTVPCAPMQDGESETAYLDRIAAKAKPEGAVRLPNIDTADLPPSREFRNQWRFRGGKVQVDPDLETEERWRRVEVEAQRRLKESDGDMLQALERGDATIGPLRAYRNTLRNVRGQTDPRGIVWPEKP